MRLFQQGILRSLVFHFLNFKSWIKLIYDTVDVCYFVINEFNPTFDVQNMGNKAFQNGLFGNASSKRGVLLQLPLGLGWLEIACIVGTS